MGLKQFLDKKVRQQIDQQIKECDKMINDMNSNIPDHFLNLIFIGAATYRAPENLKDKIDECLSKIVVPDYISRSIAQAIIVSESKDKDVIFDTLMSHFAVLGFTYQLREWLKSGKFDNMIDEVVNKLKF